MAASGLGMGSGACAEVVVAWIAGDARHFGKEGVERSGSRGEMELKICVRLCVVLARKRGSIDDMKPLIACASLFIGAACSNQALCDAVTRFRFGFIFHPLFGIEGF